MTLYPETQRKAQAEIERVVGPTRLPTLDDRANLPYVDALLKEILRWNPVLPLGIPHVSTSDDIVEGYHIPKGAIIISNVWCEAFLLAQDRIHTYKFIRCFYREFMRDPETYHDPLEFKPERFLGESPELDPHEIVFGFGRRICPGKQLADSTMFSTIAKSLAVFDISKAKDTCGNVIEPVREYSGGIIRYVC